MKPVVVTAPPEVEPEESAAQTAAAAANESDDFDADSQKEGSQKDEEDMMCFECVEKSLNKEDIGRLSFLAEFYTQLVLSKAVFS